jgi:tRNA(Ile)-lysidine synthase TilS/MesJ
MGLELQIVRSQIAEVVFDIRKESNPCSLCAKLRKGAFNTRAKELGCNKIAYAHHRNDFIETFLMSLIFEGRVGCFSPVSYLDRTDLTLIRPLMYVEEPDIVAFTRANALPVMKNPCPADGNTQREEMKRMVSDLNKTYHGVSERIFGAILRGDLKGWPKTDE